MPEDSASPAPAATDKPQPGDLLTEAQALRWMADNLDAGRDRCAGLELWNRAKGEWAGGLSAPDVPPKTRVGRIRVALPKQRTVNIDGTEYPVPEPMKQKPGVGQQYWFVENDEIAVHFWGGDDIDQGRWLRTASQADQRRLAEGNAYATREAADQALAIDRAIYGGGE